MKRSKFFDIAMKIKTLVVDNNPVLLKMIASILEQEGCEVQTAETGLEALEVLDSYHPAIVFTDLVMPRVSGEQLCKIIRSSRQHSNVFIVVVSAILLEDRDRIVSDIRCDLCIAKGNVQQTRLHIQQALQCFLAQRYGLSDSTAKNTHVPAGLKPSAMTSELLLERHHLAMILANLEEGILELTHRGTIVNANTAAQLILGGGEEKLIGMGLADIADWGRHREAVCGWIDGQLAGRGMKSHFIHEQSPVIINDRVVTVKFMVVMERGTAFGLCILRDISRQYFAEKYSRKLDDALKLMKKMEAMSCMAGGVAHDFNNLLTVICGNLDILTLGDKGQRQNQPTQQLLEETKKAALAAVDLTRQISGFSNFGIISRENVYINQLVADTLRDFFGPATGSYTLECYVTDCLVSVDPPEIIRALHNVLKNSQEASPGKPVEIHLNCCAFASPQLLAGQYVPAGDYARIDIRDFGPGVAQDKLFKIFDPYYSTKQRGAMKGMGLGLTVVYATLRNHGGYLVVSSIPGKETTVSLFLPVIAEAENEDSKKGRTADARKGKGHVLLIEPQQQMNEIGQIMLNHLGFSVTAVTCRNDALRELRHMKEDSLASKPLVILDISDSGDGVGVETCRLLHEIDSELQVIGATGPVDGAIVENCQLYGFVNIMPKPYSMDCLIHVTSRALFS